MPNEGPRYRLVLWDIDHTLIETRGVGSQLYRAAFEQVTGRPIEHHTDVTGKTEPVIFTETLRMHGIEPSDAQLHQYAEALAAQYQQHAEQLRRQGRALPGAREALARLATEPGIVQSVLTGNFRPVAASKLAVFELDEHLDLEVGAYGDDSSDRPRLVSIAQQRATAKYRHGYSVRDTVLVGDTVQDVMTAREGGAAIVAVATGRDSTHALRSAGAVVSLTDLTDLAQVEAAVLGTT